MFVSHFSRPLDREQLAHRRSQEELYMHPKSADRCWHYLRHRPLVAKAIGSLHLNGGELLVNVIASLLFTILEGQRPLVSESYVFTGAIIFVTTDSLSSLRGWWFNIKNCVILGHYHNV